MRFSSSLVILSMLVAGCSSQSDRPDPVAQAGVAGAERVELPAPLQQWRERARTRIASVLKEGASGDLSIEEPGGPERPLDVVRALVLLDAASGENATSRRPSPRVKDQAIDSAGAGPVALWLGGQLDILPNRSVLDNLRKQMAKRRLAFSAHKPSAVVDTWYGTIVELSVGRQPSVTDAWNVCPTENDPLDVAITLGQVARSVGIDCPGGIEDRAERAAIDLLPTATGSLQDLAMVEALARVPDVAVESLPGVCQQALGRDSDYLIYADVPFAFACYRLSAAAGVEAEMSDAFVRSLEYFVSERGRISEFSATNASGLLMEVALLSSLGLEAESRALAKSGSVIESDLFYDLVRLKYARQLPPPTVSDIDAAVSENSRNEDIVYSASLVVGDTGACPGGSTLDAIEDALGKTRSVLREAALVRALDACSRAPLQAVRAAIIRRAHSLITSDREPLFALWEAAEASCLLGEEPVIRAQTLRPGLEAIDATRRVDIVGSFAGARLISLKETGCPIDPWPHV